MKTMVLFYPGCIEFEVMLACELLNSTYPVEVVTPDGSDHVGSNGMIIKASKSLSTVVPSEYRVALFPGGDPAVLIGNPQLSDVIQNFNSSSVVLGAICAGPVLLEQAGVLKDKQIAHGYKGPQLKWLLENGFFKNTELTDKAFVVSGHIVTARPDSFVDFAVETACLAGAIESSQKDFWKEYYKGRPS